MVPHGCSPTSHGRIGRSSQVLKQVLKGKLHLPHAPARRCNMTEQWAGKSCVRQTPSRVVENVERLPAELQHVTLIRQAEVLVCGKVPIEAGWPEHCVPADVAEGKNRLQCKCVGG